MTYCVSCNVKLSFIIEIQTWLLQFGHALSSRDVERTCISREFPELHYVASQGSSLVREDVLNLS